MDRSRAIARRVTFRRLLLVALVLCRAAVAQADAAWTNVWTGNPYEVAPVTALSVAPTTPSTVFLVSGPGSAFWSPDGGTTWKYLSAADVNHSIGAIGFDPRNPRTIFLGPFEAPLGMYKSTDGTATWTFSSNGFNGAGFVDAIVVDPTTPANVYGAVYGADVFKSTDGGSNWSRTNAVHNVVTLAIDPHAPSTMYAGTGEYVARGMLGQPGTVLKTTDGGSSWLASSAGLPLASVAAVVIDPQNPTTLFAGTVETVNSGGSGSGIFKSTDGGASWSASGTSLLSGGPGVFALVIDPQTPTTLYAGTASNLYTASGAGVFKSTDAGATWTAFNTGLTDMEVTALAVDPNMPSTVYAGTKGGSLFVSAPSCCAGDCNADGSVTVDELVMIINIALGDLPTSACGCLTETCYAQGVICTLGAVDHALNGCPIATALPQ